MANNTFTPMVTIDLSEYRELVEKAQGSKTDRLIIEAIGRAVKKYGEIVDPDDDWKMTATGIHITEAGKFAREILTAVEACDSDTYMNYITALTFKKAVDEAKGAEKLKIMNAFISGVTGEDDSTEAEEESEGTEA